MSMVCQVLGIHRDMWSLDMGDVYMKHGEAPIISGEIPDPINWIYHIYTTKAATSMIELEIIKFGNQIFRTGSIVFLIKSSMSKSELKYNDTFINMKLSISIERKNKTYGPFKIGQVPAKFLLSPSCSLSPAPRLTTILHNNWFTNWFTVEGCVISLSARIS